jgi:hypothetical protein
MLDQNITFPSSVVHLRERDVGYSTSSNQNETIFVGKTLQDQS